MELLNIFPSRPPRSTEIIGPAELTREHAEQIIALMPSNGRAFLERLLLVMDNRPLLQLRGTQGASIGAAAITLNRRLSKLTIDGHRYWLGHVPHATGTDTEKPDADLYQLLEVRPKIS